MDEDAAVDESPPTSPARSVRARAASPPAAERKEEVDISKHVAMMRARSKENDLEGAMQVFRKLQSSGVQLNALAYNALLDACVQCGKVNVALQHFKEMKDLGLVDVVSYNTLLKAYLKQGQIAKARKLLTEMAENNIEANQVTYNEMLNALVAVKDRQEMWALVREMNVMGMRPNSVTCSIILKSLTAHSAPDDVRQAMSLIDNLQEDMDEVLFASVIEACVRVGQLDLLSSKLQQYAGIGGLAGLTAPTYGSMIKAYGRARDIERVRELWGEMRAHHVTPTSITLGCMVDALVRNSLPDEAFDLVRGIRDESEYADILNTVIYSTLLKGFAQSRQPGRVQDVFEEMKQMGIACNTVSYNTMLDANAMTGRMNRADELFREMQASGVSPDVITYSTLVKGYCQAGDIDRGYSVLNEMVKSGVHEPDEILYNSLLDGCAKQHRVDDALKLLEDMHKHHVRPSNFTLSILVKLLGRSRRLNQAFSMVEETCKRFDLQANIHVYTCLIFACFQNRQLPRALKLHDSMITEAGVEPDAKTYSVLARGCVTNGSLEKAAVPLLADLRAIGVHVERGVYAAAVDTSVKRAGRNNDFPEKGAFAFAKGKRNGSPAKW